MNAFESAFKIGDKAFNRIGAYTVESFDADGMWVRYEDGSVRRLADFDRQIRIMENMILDLDKELQDHELELRRQEWERGYTRDEEDVAALAQEIQGLLLPQLDDLVNRHRPRFDILLKASREISGQNYLYVILLSRLSRKLSWGFHAFGRHDMPCVYVGQSWYPPEERFLQHLVGVHSSYSVRRFGLCLLPNIFAPYQSLSRDVALMAETALADALGELGCTVFGGH